MFQPFFWAPGLCRLRSALKSRQLPRTAALVTKAFLPGSITVTSSRVDPLLWSSPHNSECLQKPRLAWGGNALGSPPTHTHTIQSIFLFASSLVILAACLWPRRGVEDEAQRFPLQVGAAEQQAPRLAAQAGCPAQLPQRRLVSGIWETMTLATVIRALAGNGFGAQRFCPNKHDKDISLLFLAGKVIVGIIVTGVGKPLCGGGQEKGGCVPSRWHH